MSEESSRGSNFKLFGATILLDQEKISEEGDDGRGKGLCDQISSEIAVEAKVFSLVISGDLFIIKEQHTRWEREMSLSEEQVIWMEQTLLRRSRSFGGSPQGKEVKIFKGAVATATEGQNSWGVFLSFHFGRDQFLVFPSGYGGCEWKRVSLWFSNLLAKGSQEISDFDPHLEDAQVAYGFSVSESQRDDLNWRLEKLLEELKFFRFSVTELCSSESNDVTSESNGSVSRSSFDGCLDPCMDLWRNEEYSDSGSTLSWEELRGYSEEEEISVSKDHGVSEGFSPELSSGEGEDDDDVAWSLVKGRQKSNSLFAEVQELTSTINAGGTPMVFEFSNSPARFDQGNQLQLLGHPDDGTYGSDVCLIQSVGSIRENQQVSTSVSVHPQISFLDALSLLCRGSTFDQPPTRLSLEKGIDEASVLEQEDDSGSWSMFVADNFRCEKGCLRPAWERLDKCEVIEALLDGCGDFSEVEDEDV